MDFLNNLTTRDIQVIFFFVIGAIVFLAISMGALSVYRAIKVRKNSIVNLPSLDNVLNTNSARKMKSITEDKKKAKIPTIADNTEVIKQEIDVEQNNVNLLENMIDSIGKAKKSPKKLPTIDIAPLPTAVDKTKETIDKNKYIKKDDFTEMLEALDD